MTYNPLDRNPESPYAHCNDCELVAQTPEDSSAHLNATFESGGKGRSHQMRVTNPTRKERLCQQIDSEIEDALAELVDELFTLHERYGATEEEITEALRFTSLDLAEAWADALAEEQS